MLTLPSVIPVSALNAEHPEYSLYSEPWMAIDLLNAGGARLKKAAEKFLQKRPKEPGDVYQERVKGFTYQNILGTIVGWYTAKLFRQSPEIATPQTPEWARWLEDCDRSGASFVAFAAKIFESMLLYRRVDVVTDLPAAEEQPVTRADEIEMGLDQPYLVAYDPRCRCNWKYDSYGRLEWVIYRSEEAAIGSPFDAKPMVERYWYVFDTEQFAVYRWQGEADKAAEKDPIASRIRFGKHPLADAKRVPVREFCLPETLWLGNRVLLQAIDHLNQENSYKWALFMANLAMLLIKGKMDRTTQTISEIDMLEVSENGDASWLEPTGASFKHSSERQASLREEMYRTAHLQAQGRSSAATPAMQSGYSKEMDMAPANDVLNLMGDIMRKGMRDVLIDVDAVRGDSTAPEELQVNGFHFETDAPAAELALAQGVKDYGINSPRLEREMAKRVARSVLEDAPAETRQAVEMEIENNPTPSEKAEQEKQERQAQFEREFKMAAMQGRMAA